jgi:hypothetical protein
VESVTTAALEAAVKAMCAPPCQYPECAKSDIAQACRGKARNARAAIGAFLRVPLTPRERDHLREIYRRIWRGFGEDDGLNGLVCEAEAFFRERADAPAARAREAHAAQVYPELPQDGL